MWGLAEFLSKVPKRLTDEPSSQHKDLMAGGDLVASGTIRVKLLLTCCTIVGHRVNEVPVFVIMHEKESVVCPEALGALVDIWKRTFHSGELPITHDYEDATNAFCQWLEEQPYGYVVPNILHGLISLPIYDVVKSQKEYSLHL